MDDTLTVKAGRRSEPGLSRLLPWADLGAVAVLGAVTAGFFWRVLTSAGVYFPAGGGDLASFLYPVYSFIASSLKQGVFPLWNPYLYGGAPFAADIQTGLFYPIHLVVFLFGGDVTYRTLEMLAVFHVWLAGVLMYICLRGLLPGESAIARLPSVTGAIAFMLSDFFVVHLGNLNMIEVAAWLPLAFLLFHRSVTSHAALSAVAAGVVLAVACFAGHIQPFLYIVLALGLYALTKLSRRPIADARAEAGMPKSRLGGLSRSRGWPLVLFIIMMAVAVGLAAPLVLPSVEMAGYTARVDLPYAEAVKYSLAPGQLIGMLVPNLFGRDPAKSWGPWDRVEMGYMGILPLALAALALALRREPVARFFGVLTIVALFLSFGGYSAIYGWLQALTPGFDKLRAPARFTLLLDFGLAALAAMGMDALLRPFAHRQRLVARSGLKVMGWAVILAAIIGTPIVFQALLLTQDKDPTIFARAGRAANGWMFFLLMAGLTLAWLAAQRWRWLDRRALAWAGVGLVALDLISLGSSVDVGSQDPTQGFRHDAAVAWLKQDPGFYRIDTRTDVWDVWQPDLSLLRGIQDVSGIYNPLAVADYETYWGNLGSRTARTYDFLNAAYLVAHKDVKLDFAKFTLAYDGDPQVNIYRNNAVMPRATVVHQARIVPRSEMLATLRAADFDPAASVLLETGTSTAASAAGSTAAIAAYDANALQVDVQAAAPGYLVLSEVWYPGWRAWVDGQPAELLRANYAFRAVAVQAGAHRVRMIFEPDTWRWGLTLAAVTVLGLAGVAVGVTVRHRP